MIEQGHALLSVHCDTFRLGKARQGVLERTGVRTYRVGRRSRRGLRRERSACPPRRQAVRVYRRMTRRITRRATLRNHLRVIDRRHQRIFREELLPPQNHQYRSEGVAEFPNQRPPWRIRQFGTEQALADQREPHRQAGSQTGPRQRSRVLFNSFSPSRRTASCTTCTVTELRVSASSCSCGVR